MSPASEVSLASAAIWSSERLRSRRTACAASWLLQKSGSATLVSSDFRRSRCCAASKKTPDQCDAGFQSFVAVLEVFKDHGCECGEANPGDTKFRFVAGNGLRPSP